MFPIFQELFTFNTKIHLFIESVHLQQRNTLKIPIKLRTTGLEAKLILLHQVKNEPLNVMMPAMFGFYIYTSGIQLLTKLKALIRSLPESKNSPERKQTAGFYSVGNLLNVDIENIFLKPNSQDLQAFGVAQNFANEFYIAGLLMDQDAQGREAFGMKTSKDRKNGKRERRQEQRLK